MAEKTKRKWVVDGDKTSAGGIVHASGTQDTLHGIPIGREWDAVSCPACNSIGQIRCVPPKRGAHMRGAQLSMDGDLCICNCKEPPRIIASARAAGMAVY